MVKDYTYGGMNLRGDPDLPFPEGEKWDNRGKKDTTTFCFCLCHIPFFCIFVDTKTHPTIL